MWKPHYALARYRGRFSHEVPRFGRNAGSRARRANDVLHEGGDDRAHEEHDRLRSIEPGAAGEERSRGENQEDGDGEAAVVEEESSRSA